MLFGCYISTWLVPHASVSAHILCTTQNHATADSVTSCKATRIHWVHVCLAPALLADWLGSFSFTCCCGGPDTKITVSTESWPWRRKFSHITCCTSKWNPRLFDHKFSTLPPSHPCIPDSLIDFFSLSLKILNLRKYN